MTVPDVVESLITDRKLMAHVATARDDRPHVAPVWYAYDDGVFEAVTGGRKLENARANPRVAISIQRDQGGDAEWMVAMQGTASVIEDPERRRAAAERIFPKYLGPDPEEWDPYYRDGVEDHPEGMLLRVRVGSATYQTY